LKSTSFRYLFAFIFIAFLIACSTKKDKFMNRKFQALNTENNVLFNGNVALEAGLNDIIVNYNDSYWETLPIERMQPEEEEILLGQNKNANFEKAEEKATKAIQKRSMLIGGSEKNPQMDEAYLLLGKARYYDRRFVPALEAFNYILYKNADSDKIYEAKIWREKTNVRLDYDGLAVNNLTKLLNEIDFKDQIFADANATLAQAYLNLEQKDSAISKLNKAIEFTKKNEEKARYYFILGQLYESLDQKETAFQAYQTVIDMKRKSPRQYVIHAQIKQAQQFDFTKGDTLLFLAEYNKLLEDRENRPFLDFLYHQKALFYDKQNNDKQAVSNYNKSLSFQSNDKYVMASNYRNMAEIYFYQAAYQTSGKYFDSTLVLLNQRTREFKSIKKKRDNLEDVIKYEGIAQRNDSIINIFSLSSDDKKAFFEDYITKIKKQDEIAFEKEKTLNESRENEANNANASSQNQLSITNKASFGSTSSKSSTFYFYNPSSVEFGKIEFVKKWGKRASEGNWRLAKGKKVDVEEEVIVEKGDEKKTDKKEDIRYSSDFYVGQLPQSQKEIDSIAKERNYAYYQLGVIYKEKFKEYQLAADRLEILIKSKPEERLVLPAMYNLYKIYEIIDPAKALAMKDKIISEFPDSRYAQILSKTGTAAENMIDDPQIVYKNLFKEYEKGEFRKVFAEVEPAIEKFTGEETLPKFELLKTSVNGKIKGVFEYKKGLNYVALTYPNSEEGKEAELLLSNNIPYLESLYFDQEDPTTFKILYKADNVDDKKTKTVIQKVTKFIKDRNQSQLTTSIDLYEMDKNFFVIHGLVDEEYAKGIVSILKEFKDYKITEPTVIISSENYKIIQIRKNLNEYLDPTLRVVPPPYVAKQKQPKRAEERQEIVIPTKNKKNTKPAQSSNSMRPPSGNDATNDSKGNINNNSQNQNSQSQMTPPSPANPKKG
jgi:tetratricopeptide (TPR) repeat protein